VRQIGPNFFIVGAAKAATTSLSSLLETHPQAAIVRFKEPHFFSYDYRYAEGWRLYLTLFSHVSDEKAVGDASTSYSRIRYHPQVIERIKRHVPDAKIIYMVRHPIERMESAYVEHMCTGDEMPFTSINDIIRRQPMIIDSSRYWEVFDAYRRAFGEERIKIVWFEEYIADRKTIFQKVCRFLEIDDQFEPNLDRERVNSREDAAMRMARLGRGGIPLDLVWSENLRRETIAQIRDDNLRFLAHFGRPANYWGDLFENGVHGKSSGRR
ncbi:putative sulfotransferase, partial [Mycobacterium terramassiliense]